MGRTAVWTAISEKLLAEIGSGQRQPGDKLPSEAELAARFGVNRHTVRRALSDLAERGLVHSRRGSGVFVQGKSIEYPIGKRTRMSTNLAAIGREAGRQLISLETRYAADAEAEALQIASGAQVHAMEGISVADGQPIAVFRSVFSAARFPDMPPLLRRYNSITRALAESGVDDYIRAETRLTAKRASADIALHLRLREGDPILRAVSINVDREGGPVEYGHTWFAGDRVTLQVRASDVA